ncbi:MAG: lipoyl(octanoyl) transferase LipB [Fimbriimonadales bacterium]|nr:lipoyl(octanoyl) transferase LipB [Fimbriimonadales bacterium]
MEYSACWELQKQLAKLRAMNEIPDTLLFVEHDPVYSLGANFHQSNLLYDNEFYESQGISIQLTDRGGDITYHGPNQLVIYPIFNLKDHGSDLHKWLRDLEQATIETVAAFGLSGTRFPPNTGVWIDDRKIAAIGIKVSKWVNTHGIALNCDNDLTPFKWIVPCGIDDYGVTSLTESAGREVTTKQAMPHAVAAFDNTFDLKLEKAELQQLAPLAR